MTARSGSAAGVALVLHELAARIEWPERAVVEYESLRDLRLSIERLEAGPLDAHGAGTIAIAAGALEAAVRASSRRIYLYDGGYDDVTRDVLELARRATSVCSPAARGVVLPVGTAHTEGHALELSRSDDPSADAAFFGARPVDRVALTEGSLALGRVAPPGALRLASFAIDKHAIALRVQPEGLEVALRGRDTWLVGPDGARCAGPRPGWEPFPLGATIEVGPIRVAHRGLRPTAWVSGVLLNR